MLHVGRFSVKSLFTDDSARIRHFVVRNCQREKGREGRVARGPGDAPMDSLSANFAQKSFRSVGRSRDELGVGATLPAAFNRTLFDHETRSRCIGPELALFAAGPFAIMGRPARDKSQAVLLHPPGQS